MFVVEGYLHQSDNTVAFGPFDDEASAREFVSKLISEHQCEDINITKVNSPMTHPRLWVVDSKEWIEESARGVERETRHIDKEEAVTEEEIDGPTRFADEGPKEAQNAC